jgi:hypothetical protein
MAEDGVLSPSEMYSRGKLPVVLSIQPTRFRLLKEPAVPGTRRTGRAPDCG